MNETEFPLETEEVSMICSFGGRKSCMIHSSMKKILEERVIIRIPTFTFTFHWHPSTRIDLSHEKNPPTFHYTGCLIGIHSWFVLIPISLGGIIPNIQQLTNVLFIAHLELLGGCTTYSPVHNDQTSQHMKNGPPSLFKQTGQMFTPELVTIYSK